MITSVLPPRATDRRVARLQCLRMCRGLDEELELRNQKRTHHHLITQTRPGQGIFRPSPAACRPPAFHTTVRGPKRAHLSLPAFKNTKKTREDPQREKKSENGSGRVKKKKKTAKFSAEEPMYVQESGTRCAIVGTVSSWLIVHLSLCTRDLGRAWTCTTLQCGTYLA